MQRRCPASMKSGQEDYWRIYHCRAHHITTKFAPMRKPQPIEILEPVIGVAICGEPRAGTTYLAELMTSTGKLGKPFEWFQDGPVAARTERNPERELGDMLDQAKTP